MKNILSVILSLLIICSCIFPSNYYNKNTFLSDKEYITGDDGVIRMNINILGHVKSPGIYLVYDGIDIMSALSIAGGYLAGSNINKIVVYKKNGEKKIINLNDLLNNNSIETIQFDPNDTIYVREKILSKIFSTSNLPSIILNLLNIALTIERTK